MHLLSIDAYRRAVSLRDLTDPTRGPHAMQLLLADVVTALRRTWGCGVREHRANPVVPIEDNYDRLHYPRDGAARDARYTRYVSDRMVLRTQTSAMIPDLLAQLAHLGPSPSGPSDTLLVCPGLVYRRDAIDRLHTGEPHQVDLWRIRTGAPRLRGSDLEQMVHTVVRAALPGVACRTRPAEHPYTTDGLEIEVHTADGWVEIGECGLALPALLQEAGLDPNETTGLAMGLGLDRLVMLRKGLDDIRLLRATDPRVATQMTNLDPWRPVSSQPATRRDLSLVVSEDATDEQLGDAVRESLGAAADAVESLEPLARTPWADLTPAVRQRLGMHQGQANLLLRLTLRHLDRALTAEEANGLRNRVYAALHQGCRAEWA